MKGLGTFRRALLTIGSALGLVGSLPATPQASSFIPDEEKREPRKRRRSRVLKGKHTPSSKKFTMLRWGDCPAPLSRKVLKRIASNHPALVK